jgi:metal-responsive CopG/Arc/MetJ family transcriptional regulator
MINKNKKEQTKRVSISLTTETYYAVENLMAGTGLSRSRAIENVLRENRDIKKGISKIRLEKEYGNISTSSVHKHKEPVSLKTETQKD